MNNLKTSEIRPEQAENRYYELYQEEISKFLSPETGLVRKELLTFRVCPVCDSDGYVNNFIKDGFNFVTCSHCGLLYVNPTLRNENLKEYYENSKAMDFFQQNILMPTRKVRNERIFKPRVEFVSGYCSGGELLDVGCAIGNFLECLKENPDWVIRGVEPNVGAASYVREELGIPVENCLLEETGYENKSFDVITFWEAVEHLQNPIEVLRYCHKLLKREGHFFVSTPNISGLEFQVAGEKHFNIGAPNHLNYFSPSTLKRLLIRAGFRKVEVITPGKMDIENIKIFLKQGIGREVLGTFLTEVILGETDETRNIANNLQRFIGENHLSGNMVAVCRK